MRERSLVAFTLLAQAAVGLFWAVLVVRWVVGPGVAPWLAWPLALVGPLVLAAALVSLLHLGTPSRAWRALTNVRRSWLSREILLTGVFGAGWVVVVGWGATGAVAAVTAVAGAALIYAMSRVYRLPTVPAWDTPLTPASFFLAAASLGSLGAAVTLGVVAGPDHVLGLLGLAAGLFIAVELSLEVPGAARRREAARQVDAGLNPTAAVPFAPARWRPPLLVAALALAEMAWLSAIVLPVGPWLPLLVLGLALAAVAMAEILGRVRFYASHARRGV